MYTYIHTYIYLHACSEVYIFIEFDLEHTIIVYTNTPSHTENLQLINLQWLIRDL